MKTEEQVQTVDTLGSEVHHVPVGGNLNSRIGYCGYRSKLPAFRGIPMKEICATCEMLWELDGRPSP